MLLCALDVIGDARAQERLHVRKEILVLKFLEQVRFEELSLHLRADGGPGTGQGPQRILGRRVVVFGEGDDGVDDGSAGNRQSLCSAACALGVAETETKSRLELVGLGEKHGLAALQRRPCRR